MPWSLPLLFRGEKKRVGIEDNASRIIGKIGSSESFDARVSDAFEADIGKQPLKTRFLTPEPDRPHNWAARFTIQSNAPRPALRRPRGSGCELARGRDENAIGA
jgi:hypothetical protein